MNRTSGQTHDEDDAKKEETIDKAEERADRQKKVSMPYEAEEAKPRWKRQKEIARRQEVELLLQTGGNRGSIGSGNLQLATFRVMGSSPGELSLFSLSFPEKMDAIYNNSDSVSK